MQKKFGFKPLGPADGKLKNTIVSDNAVKLYGFEAEKVKILSALDRISEIKADYEQNGPGRSNLRYGFIPKLG